VRPFCLELPQVLDYLMPLIGAGISNLFTFLKTVVGAQSFDAMVSISIKHQIHEVNGFKEARLLVKKIELMLDALKELSESMLYKVWLNFKLF